MSEKKETKSMELQRQEVQLALSPAGQEEKAFAILQRKGMMFAASTIVPDAYRNNVGNCIIALEMAQRMNALPLMIMQNLYIVHNSPAFSSKFLIACINSSKRFSPLRYEFRGKEGEADYGCRAYAYEINDTEHKERLEGDWITWKMVKAEGWDSKSGSKWKSMPNQMFRYRAAAFWQRTFCPEISMGLITAEEAEDIPYTEYTEISNEEIAKANEAADKATQAMQQAMAEATKVNTETGEIINE